VGRRGLGFWRRCGIAIVKTSTRTMTKRTWSGLGNIPETGGFILAANHVSEFDPLVVAHFVLDAGRWPRFLTKSSLFDIPLLGPFLHELRQIPVYRGTAAASAALRAATDALEAGHGVIVYPEGTTPKEGDFWPRTGKTGVARLFLATAVPVIPVVTWGPQQVFDPRTRKWRLRPGTPVTVLAAPPLDLSAWAGAPPTAANLRAITDDIMAGLTDLLTAVRAVPSPEAEVDEATDARADERADQNLGERVVPQSEAGPADGGHEKVAGQQRRPEGDGENDHGTG
jgi:1-acyl-sn-glycerol-3-phosphate acyltransferase